MPEATEKPVKLTLRDVALLRECDQYAILDDHGTYYRLGGHGYAPIRYNRASLPRLGRMGLVAYRMGRWKTTPAGRAHLTVATD